MIKFLLILIALFFVFGNLIRLLIKYAVIGFAHKHSKDSFSQAQGSSAQFKPNANNQGRKNKSGGDYIDYEIVK